jgi:TRAP-type C4-dicarboxylate transport system permease small subunit
MGITVCGVICWYGAKVTWGQYVRGVTDIQVVDMPKYLILMIIPLGFLILTLQFLRNFFTNLNKVRTLRDSSPAGDVTSGHGEP